MPSAGVVCQVFLAKAGGPGSRGGRVLGHTSSGRAIYARRGSGHDDYRGFSAADHLEAARFHLGRAGVLNHRAHRHNSGTPDGGTPTPQAGRHMNHYLGHIGRAKRLNDALPAPQRLASLA